MNFSIEEAYQRVWLGYNQNLVTRSLYDYTSLETITRRKNKGKYKSPATNEVMKSLPDGEFKVEELARKVGININSVRSVITRAVNKGLVVRLNENTGHNIGVYKKNA